MPVHPKLYFQKPFCALILSIIFLFFSTYVCGQSEHSSVVQIEVYGAKRGIGVVVNKPDHVVTALHVVAGVPNISVYSKAHERTVPAKIIRVHRESDLALLKLNTPLNLPPIKISSENPKSAGKYFIYSYNRTPDVIDFPMRLASRFFPLSSIIAPTTPQYQWLINHGFPLPQAQIIRLADPIRHGDSGSPIVDTNGNLIGIADGGLKQGTQRLNWGISAAHYINALWNSKEDVNVPKSTLPFLKNARFENELFLEENDLEIYKIFSESLGEIYQTALFEDRSLVDTYRGYALDLSQKDIFDLVVDVYEDYSSGATMAVPQGLSFEYDQESGMLTAWTENKNVEMNILVKKAQSWEDANIRIDEFEEILFEDDDWEEISNPDNPPDYDEEERFYSNSISAYTVNDFGEKTGSFFAEILVDDAFVMASSVKVYDIALANENKIDWYYCYALEACLVLGGFAIH